MTERRRVLVVLDDVWEESHARPLLPGGLGSAALITTRRRDLVTRLRARSVNVDQMRPGEASRLLARWLDVPSVNQRLLEEFGRYLGEWPLLLQLSGAYLHGLVALEGLSAEEAIADLRSRFEERGVGYLDQADSGDRDKAISINLDLSLQRLGRWRQRFLDLAVFPRGIDVPFSTIQKLWSRTAALDHIDGEDALRAMHRLSLFTRYVTEDRVVRLHDVISAYLAGQKEDRLPALHEALLDAHCPAACASPERADAPRAWHALPREEPYLWKHLAYHLRRAGRSAELVATVKDLCYLAARTHASSAHGAETDLRDAEECAPQDADLSLLRRSLASMVHVLNQCERLNDLVATLSSRLQHLDELAPLTHGMTVSLRRPHLALWHPLPDIPHPGLIRTFTGHKLFVHHCAMSADGSTIVSTSYDKTGRVWDGRSGQLRFSFAATHACGISADGGTIAAAGEGNVLQVWDSQTGQLRLSLQGHTERIFCCALSADGHVIVSGADDSTVRVWDGRSGQLLHMLRGHRAAVRGCGISADGSRIVSTASDGTLKVWDGRTGRLRSSFNGHLGCCALSADGRAVVSATSVDGRLKVRTGQTFEVCTSLSGHASRVFGCSISSDGSVIASASVDRTVKVWDGLTGQHRVTLTGHTGQVWACALSADGRLVVSSSDDFTLKLWETRKERVHAVPQAHGGEVSSCAASADGRTIVSASVDKTIKVWDGNTGTPRHTLKGHTGAVSGCSVSADGKVIASAAGRFSPANRLIALSNLDGSVKIWDAQTGQLRRSIEMTDRDEAGDCALSADGSVLVSASSREMCLRVWDSLTGELRHILQGHTESKKSMMLAIEGCAISYDGKTIMSAAVDHTARLWDGQSGQLLHTLEGHEGPVAGCAISADGGIAVSASNDGTLKVWSGRTGRLRLTLVGHKALVSGCAISSDSRRIVSSSFDRTLRVWDAASGACLAVLAVDAPLNDCACIGRGEQIVAAGKHGLYFFRFVE